MVSIVLIGENHKSANLKKVGEFVTKFTQDGKRGPILVENCILTKREMDLIDGAPISKPSDCLLHGASTASMLIKIFADSTVVYIGKRGLEGFSSEIEPIESPSLLYLCSLPIGTLGDSNDATMEMIKTFRAVQETAPAFFKFADKALKFFRGSGSKLDEGGFLELKAISALFKFFSNFNKKEEITNESLNRYLGALSEYKETIKFIRSSIQALRILKNAENLPDGAHGCVYAIVGKAHVPQILDILQKRKEPIVNKMEFKVLDIDN
jgi:hypothetical protein